MLRLSCDFENTVNNKDRTRVWLYATMEINNHANFNYGYDIEDFFEHLLSIREKKIECYFHNLGYDGYLILDWLMKNGFTYSKNKEPNTFSTLISKFNVFYQIDLRLPNKRRIVFLDSYKKIPLSVKSIAKAYELPIKKGSIDYLLPREKGYVATPDEISYIKNDVEIVAYGLEHQFEQELLKMTIGADSLNNYKKKFLGDSAFNEFFPTLSVGFDEDIRRAYRGGKVDVMESRKGIEQGEGVSYDNNSMYPYVMWKYKYPYGTPLFFKGEVKTFGDYDTVIQSVTIECSLKEGHIPMLQIKGRMNYKDTEYIKRTVEPTTIWVTDVDYEVIKEHYYIHNEKFICGYVFKSKEGFFKSYVEYWSKVKEENEGGLRQLAKLMLNNLYGKFATNTNTTGKIPILEDNRVKLILGEKETRKPVYTAVAVFVTAYARRITIEAVQANYDRVCYWDTDSIHLVGLEPPKGIKVHPTKLGHWKKEYTFSRAKYLRAKTYCEEVLEHDKLPKGTLIVKCAGMKDGVKNHMTWEKFNIGYDTEQDNDLENVRDAQMKKKIVEGGSILVEAKFKIH